MDKSVPDGGRRGPRAVGQAREAQRVAEETPRGPKEYVKMDSDAKTEKL